MRLPTFLGHDSFVYAVGKPVGADSIAMWELFVACCLRRLRCVELIIERYTANHRICSRPGNIPRRFGFYLAIFSLFSIRNIMTLGMDLPAFISTNSSTHNYISIYICTWAIDMGLFNVPYSY